MIEEAEKKRRDSQSQAATQSTLKRELPKSPSLTQKLGISPAKKTVKFDEVLTQYNIPDNDLFDDDDDLAALLDELDDSASAAQPTEVKTSVSQTMRLVQPSQIQSSQLSLPDSLFNEEVPSAKPVLSINPASVDVNMDVDDKFFDDSFDVEVLSLSQSTPKTASQAVSVKFSPTQRTVEVIRQVMHAETFTLDQLIGNIRSIDRSLILDPISTCTGKRLEGPAALMIKKFRHVGPSVQLTLMDGSGSEIEASMCAYDLKIHFGMILVLKDVSIYTPIPGVHFLNIVDRNIVSTHENVQKIN